VTAGHKVLVGTLICISLKTGNTTKVKEDDMNKIFVIYLFYDDDWSYGSRTFL
jgi:predicted RecA/RadA family phage recombinase